MKVFLENGSNSPRSVRRAAMDCLARREHSFFELKHKLQLKFPDRDPAEIQRELERLREENLQSDRRFVEAFVRYRKSRGYGYPIIRDELRRRFVAESVIDSYLFADDSDWQLILDYLIEKRVGQGLTVEYGGREHQRLVRFLQRRGFTQSDIQRSLTPHLVRRAS
ncbi:MAG: regulatory protein RecX [Gammaproteobacteria bacterium]|nr:regulatory protein RecX [Pseudomonadales bacterium]MCP5346392.1 regulatory protein RecX [Pseudomonadales bacterium]